MSSMMCFSSGSGGERDEQPARAGDDEDPGQEVHGEERRRELGDPPHRPLDRGQVEGGPDRRRVHRIREGDPRQEDDET